MRDTREKGTGLLDPTHERATEPCSYGAMRRSTSAPARAAAQKQISSHPPPPSAAPAGEVYHTPASPASSWYSLRTAIEGGLAAFGSNPYDAMEKLKDTVKDSAVFKGGAWRDARGRFVAPQRPQQRAEPRTDQRLLQQPESLATQDGMGRFDHPDPAHSKPPDQPLPPSQVTVHRSAQQAQPLPPPPAAVGRSEQQVELLPPPPEAVGGLPQQREHRPLPQQSQAPARQSANVQQPHEVENLRAQVVQLQQAMAQQQAIMQQQALEQHTQLQQAMAQQQAIMHQALEHQAMAQQQAYLQEQAVAHAMLQMKNELCTD